MTREFHLGDVLSITTGHLVSPRHIEGVYDILDFMTGDQLFTHQLPRASRECAPYLLNQHPQLGEIDASAVNKDNWQEWMDQQIEKYGERLTVVPLPPGAHKRKHPIAEAIEMGTKDTIACDTTEESAEALIRELKNRGR